MKAMSTVPMSLDGSIDGGALPSFLANRPPRSPMVAVQTGFMGPFELYHLVFLYRERMLYSCRWSTDLCHVLKKLEGATSHGAILIALGLFSSSSTKNFVPGLTSGGVRIVIPHLFILQSL